MPTDLGPLRERLLADSDLDIGLLGHEKVERVVTAQMAELGVASVEELASRIGSSARRRARLLHELVSTPERFFEDPDLTSLLGEHIIPGLIDSKKPGDSVRVWVPNCRQGYLVYEVAMLLLDAIARSSKTIRLQVFATDADKRMIARARSRDYPPERFEELRARGTALAGKHEGAFKRDAVRNAVVFGAHDLLHDVPYHHQDLVVCGGYLPLLDTGARQRVVAKLVQALALSGILVGGRGEVLGLDAEPPRPSRPFGVLQRRIPEAFDLRDREAQTVPSVQAQVFAERLRMPALVVGPRGEVITANVAGREALEAEGLDNHSLLDAGEGSRFGGVAEAVVEAGRIDAAVCLRCGDGWVAGVAPVGRESGQAPLAAVVLLRHPRLEAVGEAELAVRDSACQMAEVVAEEVEHDREIESLRRQSALMTHSLYARTEDLSATRGRLESANAELRITNRQLKNALTERAKAQDQLQAAYDREHHIADTLQRSLLPTSAERYDGYSIATRYRAAFEEAEVGGDFFHVGRGPKGRLILALGDVAGKGLEAAVFAYMVKNMLLGFSSEDPAPSSMLARLNDAVAHYTEAGQFVTLTYMLLDLETGRIEMGNAGHEPVACCSASTGFVDYILPTGPAFGILPGASYGQVELQMEPGDMLVAYTDGVSEAGDRANPFGHEGVGNLLRAEVSRPPNSVLERLYETVVSISGGRLHDDAAAVCLKRDT